MSTAAASGVIMTNCPAMIYATNDWIGELLAGSTRNNIIIASVAAGALSRVPS
jgi:hypothetical protein